MLRNKICRLPITFLVLYALLFLVVRSGSQGKSYPYELHEIVQFGAPQALDFTLLDLENDGVDELLVLYRETHIRCSLQLSRNIDRQVLGQRNYINEELTAAGLFFRNGLGEPRICVITKQNNTNYVEVLDSRLTLRGKWMLISGVDRNGSGAWDGNVRPALMRDFNNDGYVDFLGIIESNFDYKPRGLLAFDFKNQRLLWKFYTGATITSVLAEDVDKDGHLEIIFGCGAPGNHSSVNGTDDSHSYLVVLTHQGERIDQYETGGLFSSCTPKAGDIHGGNRLKIVSLYQSRNPEETKVGSVSIRDALSLSIEREYLGLISPMSLMLSDLDFNHRQEIIIATDLPNELMVLSDSLHLLRRYALPFRPQNIRIASLENAEKLEIIISDAVANRTLVLDHRLKPIAEVHDGGKIDVFNQGLGKSRLLMILSPNKGIYLYHLQKLALVRNPSNYKFGLAFLFGVLLLASVLLLHKKLSAATLKETELALLMKYLPIGIFWADSHNTIKACNPAAASLCFTNADSSEIPAPPALQPSSLMKLIHQYIVNSANQSVYASDEPLRQKIKIDEKEMSLFMLPVYDKGKRKGQWIVMEDLSALAHSQKAVLWAALAQRLAHEIKNPLCTVLLTLQRLQMAYQEDGVANVKKYDAYSNSIIEDVERLRKVTDGFMKFTQLQPLQFTMVTVSDFVANIEQRLLEWLPEKITFKIESEPNLPMIRVDIDQIYRLFYNVIDNAVKAMQGKGRILFHVSLLQRIENETIAVTRDYILFEISDTGSGMSQDQMEQVFEAYRSFRTGGTGLGLNICRTIVTDHGGRISLQSREGVGTTVRIEIPAMDGINLGKENHG